jgi:DNA-binding SARP family transcriptional activator
VALANRPLQRLHVASSLWLDLSEEHANACLRSALWRLRRSAAAVLSASHTQLRLRAEVSVDVHELAAEAHQILSGGSSLNGSTALFAGGDLLADWYDDWVIVERERIRQLQLCALEERCGRLTADGRFGEAVEAGVAAVSAEPLRESAHRVLIRAFIAAGNACDALRQYQLCRELLDRQLGLRPSAALIELLDSMPGR